MQAKTRREFLKIGTASGLSVMIPGQAALAQQRRMARVILDNDYTGDPDGLFQLAHHVLSPSMAIPLIVGTHLPANFAWSQDGRAAARSAAKANELLTLMRLNDRYHAVAGTEVPITSRSAWKPSTVTAAIVREAMRDDTQEPLIYAAGAGLTELALAWLAEPRIGKRIKLVWIGGNEHPNANVPHPPDRETEFNFLIDPLAAQILFNESNIEIWQVPRDVYRQMLFSSIEIEELGRTGPIGRYLSDQIAHIAGRMANAPLEARPPAAETFVLGDSPLVTLTALVSPLQPDPSSSAYRVIPTPRLNDKGEYVPTPDGRPMRVYTTVDTRLTFRDMIGKIRKADARLPR